MIVLWFSWPKCTKKEQRGEYMRNKVKQIYFRLSELPRVCPECSEPPIRSCDKGKSWGNGFHPLFLALLAVWVAPWYPQTLLQRPVVFCVRTVLTVWINTTGTTCLSCAKQDPLKPIIWGERARLVEIQRRFVGFFAISWNGWHVTLIIIILVDERECTSKHICLGAVYVRNSP